MLPDPKTFLTATTKKGTHLKSAPVQMKEAGHSVFLAEGTAFGIHSYYQSSESGHTYLEVAGEGFDASARWWAFSPDIEIVDSRKPVYPEWDLSMDFASRIVRYMMDEGFDIVDGFRERNIVYLEGLSPSGLPNADRIDEWNDISCVISFDKKKPYFADAPCRATTEPGLHYTKNRMNPKGAFRIQFGQHKAAWTVGTHGYDQHEALVQVGEITGHRDDNEDGKRTGDKLDTGDNFYVNQHGPYTFGTVGRSSAGCLVRQHMSDHDHFMWIVKRDPRYLENRWFRFDTTVIDGAAFARSRWGYK